MWKNVLLLPLYIIFPSNNVWLNDIAYRWHQYGGKNNFMLLMTSPPYPLDQFQLHLLGMLLWGFSFIIVQRFKLYTELWLLHHQKGRLKPSVSEGTRGMYYEYLFVKADDVAMFTSVRQTSQKLKGRFR